MIVTAMTAIRSWFDDRDTVRYGGTVPKSVLHYGAPHITLRNGRSWKRSTVT